LAFGAPILSRFGESEGKVNSIILAPTRELAIQVNDELLRIAKFTKIKLLPVYGGQPIDRQISALRRGIDIIVGTPGRVLDLIKRKVLDLSSVKFLVLDEADEMLNMGFIDDIEEIIKQCDEERQTMLFSATMPAEIKKLAKRYMKPETKHIAILKNTMTVAAKVNREDVGDIDILEKFSFVNVTEAAAESIIKHCSGKKLTGRKVNIEISTRARG
jgi:ATP-dependent RNA helicase DeaD